MDERRLDALLDGFAAPVAPPPGAPAARERGDRLRRRRRGAVAVAAAVAVVAVVVPVGLLGGGGTAAPVPADGPATVEPPRLELPDSFPLTEGVDETPTADGVAAAPAELRGCGQVWWEPVFEPEAVALRGATWTPPASGGTQQRFVALYANPEDAAAGYADLGAGYQQCEELSAPGTTEPPNLGPPDGPGLGGSLSLEPSPYPEADESSVIVLGASTGGDRTTAIVLARTGNLVYAALYDIGGAVPAGRREAVSASRRVVEAMTPFRAGTVELDLDADLDADAVDAPDAPDGAQPPEQALLVPDDLAGVAGTGAWEITDTAPGDAATVCQPTDALARLDAATAITRRLEGTARTGGPVVLTETVLEHDSVEAAARSRGLAGRWQRSCDLRNLGVVQARPVDPVSRFTPARDPDVTAGTSVDLAPGGDGLGRLVRTDGGVAIVAVARVGDRVVLLGVDGPSGLLSDEGDTLLRAAADRMVGLDPTAEPGSLGTGG